MITHASFVVSAVAITFCSIWCLDASQHHAAALQCHVMCIECNDQSTLARSKLLGQSCLQVAAAALLSVHVYVICVRVKLSSNCGAETQQRWPVKLPRSCTALRCWSATFKNLQPILRASLCLPGVLPSIVFDSRGASLSRLLLQLKPASSDWQAVQANPSCTRKVLAQLQGLLAAYHLRLSSPVGVRSSSDRPCASKLDCCVLSSPSGLGHAFTAVDTLTDLLSNRDALTPAATDPRRFKTSVVFSIPEDRESGALFKALSVFALRDIDLTLIESRPQRAQPIASAHGHLPGKRFRYLFHVDFAANLSEPLAQNALRHLQVSVPHGCTMPGGLPLSG